MKVNQQKYKRDSKQDTCEQSTNICALIGSEPLQGSVKNKRYHHQYYNIELRVSPKDCSRNSYYDTDQFPCAARTYGKLPAPEEKGAVRPCMAAKQQLQKTPKLR